MMSTEPAASNSTPPLRPWPGPGLTGSPGASGTTLLASLLNSSSNPSQAGPVSRTGLAAASTSGSSGASEPDFKQLLTTLVIGMAMSSMSGAAGADSAAGSSGINPMGAVMLTLIEKLLESTVQKDAAASAPAGEAAPPTGEPKSAPSGMPIKGGILTQAAHPGHMALDFGVPVGTEIHATLDGKVALAGWDNTGYGNLVVIENGPYRVLFAHQSRIQVKVGDTVKAGQVIGLSGNTGNSTGPHLHYEVRKNGQQIDPASFTLHKPVPQI
jgi:murein DD-endopeptidase MepM/ murein hydrolase activator NlpD